MKRKWTAELEQALRERIEQIGEKEGINLISYISAERFERKSLERSQRNDPHNFLPEAHSIVVVGVYIGGHSLPHWDDPRVGRTSRLFLSGFTRDVVLPIVPIASFLKEEGFQALICDTLQPEGSVIPLKQAALRAGMGWQGKNSLILSSKFGSFLALGGLITDALFESTEEKREDRCGNCRNCIEACPTGAIFEPYVVKQEKCINYLLEDNSPHPEASVLIGNRIFECEICQTVCPWNKPHLESSLQTKRALLFKEHLAACEELFQLSRLEQLNSEQYQDLIATPFRTEVSYAIFRRNVERALANSGQILNGSPRFDGFQ